MLFIRTKHNMQIDHMALHPQKQGCLLGTGTGGEGDERVKAEPQISPEKDWRDRGTTRTMEVSRRCPLAITQRLVHRAIAVSTAVLGQSHEDNVRCTAVEEQPQVKEVQLSQPSSTSLLMISSGLTLRSSSTSLLLISPGTPW